MKIHASSREVLICMAVDFEVTLTTFALAYQMFEVMRTHIATK